LARSVVELGARATVLEAAERLADAPPDGDIALVVAPGAPLLRSAVFLDVLRSQAAPRRLSLVTRDARARSVAASVHVPAYSDLHALERRELDPTEPLTVQRRAAVGVVRRARRERAWPSGGRALAIAGSLLGALLILAAVVVPEARVVVSPAVEPLGPFELSVRAGPGGEVPFKTLTAPVTARVQGSASGQRVELVAARATVQLENKTTNDIAIPRATIFKTPGGAIFLTTADVTLPRSTIVPPFTLFLGRASVGVEAAVAGPSGNVGASTITVSPDPQRYTVSNPEPATGGEERRIPVVKLEDYDAAVQRAPAALRAAAEERLATWTREPREKEVVVQQVAVRQTALGPPNSEIVGKETATFELSVEGIATAYAVSDAEPRGTALAKLRDAVRPGNEIDERASVVNVKSLGIGEDGVTWQLDVGAVQRQVVDARAIAQRLAGRPWGEAQRIAASERLELRRLDWIPGWWPLLPLLEARITVDVETPAPR